MKRPAKIAPCWHCGAAAFFQCARCHKPICVTLGATATPSVSCGVLRKAKGQIGVFRLVCWPKCVHRRNPAVLAVIHRRLTADAPKPVVCSHRWPSAGCQCCADGKAPWSTEQG